MNGTTETIPHNPELESLAAFRYQGMTIEQLLISLAIKQDQTLTQIFEMRKDMNDLKERKADKTEFTSFQTLLTNLDNKFEAYKLVVDTKQSTIDNLILELKGAYRVLKYILGIGGPVWTLALLALNHYLK